MAWNGSGLYILDPSYYPEVNGTVIDAVRYNGLMADIQAGVTKALAKDGQNAATANIPFGGFKATGLGAASAAGDAVRYEQAWLIGEASVATAATCSIFAVGESTAQLTGTTTVASFGAGTAGTVKFCCAVDGFTITYNATTMITPGLTDLVLAAGDWFAVRSRGGSNAEVIQVTRRASLLTRLSDLGSAAASHTIANATYTQTWGWAWTGATGNGLVLTASSTNSGAKLLRLNFTGSSTSTILEAVSDYGTLLSVQTKSFNLNGGTLTTAGAAAATSYVTGGHAASGGGVGATGGALVLSGGDGSTAAAGGNITVKPGSGSTNGSATLTNLAGTASVTADDSALTLGGTKKLVHANQHEYFDDVNGVPTLTGGGTGATIAGSDTAMLYIAGTGSPTTVTINFADTWTTAPDIVTYGCTQAGITISHSAPSTTSFTLSFSAGLSSGTRVSIRVSALQ